MIYEFLILGGIWFWMVIGVAAILLMIEIVHEKFVAAFFTLLGFAALLSCFTKIQWSWFAENQMLLIYLGIGYLAGAVITSFVKWHFFSRDARDRYDEIKATFLRERKLADDGPIPDEHKNAWLRVLDNRYNNGSAYYRDENDPLKNVITLAQIVPQARHNKARITGWMAWWPFVAVWSILDDFFRRVWEVLYRWCQKIFQMISNFNFRGVDQDLAPPSGKINN